MSWEGMKKQPGSSQQCPVTGQEDWNSWNSICSQLKTFFTVRVVKVMFSHLFTDLVQLFHLACLTADSIIKPSYRKKFHYIHNSSQHSRFTYFLLKDFTLYFISNCIYETKKKTLSELIVLASWPGCCYFFSWKNRDYVSFPTRLWFVKQTKCHSTYHRHFIKGTNRGQCIYKQAEQCDLVI